MPRALSSAAVALVLLTAAPSTLRAQAATQQVNFTFTVPFTLQRLYPDVTEIYLHCLVGLPNVGAWAGFGNGPRVSVASLTKNADGSVSGETTVSVVATVPVDAAGKNGMYRCQPIGCVGSCSQMTPTNANPHLQVIAASPPNVTGTFVW
jgi:hypothetical protein